MDKRALGSLLSTILFFIVLIILLPFIFWVVVILLIILIIFVLYIYFRSRKIAKQFMHENQTQENTFRQYYQDAKSETESTTIAPDVIDAEFTVKKKEID